MTRNVTTLQLSVMRQIVALTAAREREIVLHEAGETRYFSHNWSLDEFRIADRLDIYTYRIEHALEALEKLGLVARQRIIGGTVYRLTEDGERFLTYTDAAAWYAEWRAGGPKVEAAS